MRESEVTPYVEAVKNAKEPVDEKAAIAALLAGRAVCPVPAVP